MEDVSQIKQQQRSYLQLIKETGGGEQPKQPPALLPDEHPESVPVFTSNKSPLYKKSASAPPGGLLPAHQAYLLDNPTGVTGFSLAPTTLSQSRPSSSALDILSQVMADCGVPLENNREVEGEQEKCGERVYPRAFYPISPTGLIDTTLSEQEMLAADRRAAEREAVIQAAADR